MSRENDGVQVLVAELDILFNMEKELAAAALPELLHNRQSVGDPDFSTYTHFYVL